MNRILTAALVVALVVLTSFRPKPKCPMFKTTDGRSYNIRTAKFSLAESPSATLVRPWVFVKSGDQQPATFFQTTPTYNQFYFTLDAEKPIIPLYYSILVYRSADMLPIFMFATPFMVELGDVPTIPPFPLYGSNKYQGYAQKIAPYSEVFFSRYISNSYKSFTGDIVLRNAEKIRFHSNDFLTDRPTYLFPTDTPKWYLNFADLQSGGVVDINSTAVLSYLFPSTGQTYIATGTLMFAQLE